MMMKKRKKENQITDTPGPSSLLNRRSLFHWATCIVPQHRCKERLSTDANQTVRLSEQTIKNCFKFSCTICTILTKKVRVCADLSCRCRTKRPQLWAAVGVAGSDQPSALPDSASAASCSALSSWLRRSQPLAERPLFYAALLCCSCSPGDPFC